MKYYDKTCQRCNQKYVGTASSKYCIVCRDQLRQERIKENNINVRKSQRQLQTKK